MKTRTQSCVALLCIFLSASLFSCSKEVAPAQPRGAILTDADGDNYPITDLADLIHPNEPDDESPLGLRYLGGRPVFFGNRKNLIFEFPTEATNSLTTVSNVSSTAYASLQRHSTVYSIQRTNAYSRSGRYSTRYELRKTDGDIGGSKRSETCRYTKSEPVANVERWYAASYYLPATYVYDGAPELVTQWHTNIGSPPLALWIQNGEWRLVQFGDQKTSFGAHEKNRWVDFVFHVKWNTGSTGLVEVWKNGVKVFSKTGKNIYTGTTGGAYMRTGIYKWPWKSGSTPASITTKRVLYIDDVRIGNNLATYFDVAPGAY